MKEDKSITFIGFKEKDKNATNETCNCKEFVKRMIDEHKELIDRINKLDEYVIRFAATKDDVYEYANKCIQLNAMKAYAHALEARLLNQGIVYDSELNAYFEHIK